MTLSAHVEGRLRRLISEGGLNLRAVAEACAISKTDALAWWSGRRDAGLSRAELTRFCRSFGLAETMLEGKGDLPVALLRQRAQSDAEVLPERYSENAFGFVRGVSHILEFLTLYCGRPHLEQILNEMHVHIRYFDQVSRPLNLRFTLDLFARLKARGMDDEMITGLGRFVSLRNQESALGALFADAETHARAYAVLSRHIDKFDANFEFVFTGSRRRQRVELKPQPAIEKILAEYPAAEVARYFRYLKKAMGWFPTLSGLSPVEPKALTCISRGNATSTYQIELSRTDPSHLTQILGGRTE